MAKFEDFSDYIKRFKWVAALIVGGAGLSPVIAAMAGFDPAWPNGISIITSLLIIVTLILAFVFTTDISAAWKRAIIATSALTFIGSLFFYLYLFDRFVYLVPNTEASITLGCGWTKDARNYAKMIDISLDEQCPGDFEEMLSNAEYLPQSIWLNESLTTNRLKILASWLLTFTALSAFLGSFVATLSGSPKSVGEGEGEDVLMPDAISQD